MSNTETTSARPEPRIEIIDHAGASFISAHATIRSICSGMRWSEGPLFLPEPGMLLFSDIPNNRIMQWTESGLDVYRQPANFANGRTLDRDGNILTCEQGTRGVWSTRRDGSRQLVVDRYLGKRLNSPNDVIVSESDGSIWFTDPPYGIESDYEGYRADSEIGANYVYRFDKRDGGIFVVADDFDRPNGLAFSPDEKLLYIADSGASLGAGYADPFVPDRAHHIRVFEVAANGALLKGRVFVEIDSGVPDGIKVDQQGNVWSSAWDGVRCYSPCGDLLVRIVLPEITSNLTFANASQQRLFITASSSVYQVDLNSVSNRL